MSNTMSGARAIFSTNDNAIAYASNVSYNENIAYEPVNVLDRLEVAEHAEVGYTVDMQCQNFRIPNASVKQLQIMSKLPDLLSQGELKATIVDRVTGAVILFMTGVKLQARQTSVDARGVMSETWSFVGRQSLDESGAES